MNLLPSMIWKDKRVRGLYSAIYLRPVNETFHEFLVNVVKWTFGRTWWAQQAGMEPSRRHVAVQWCIEWAEFKRDFSDERRLDADGVTYVGDATGRTWALLQLGYDFFCLQAQNKLPDFVVERLRKHREFQSARYEVAVAAIMTRAGFEIEYLDDKGIEEKHCEFIATHAASRLQVGVEAKSRRRAGVLHETGTFAHTEDARGIEKLLRKAQKQKTEATPLLIFIDVNLPPEPGVPDQEKSWVRDVHRMISRLDANRPKAPDPFAALFLTNFPHHYGWPDGKSYKGEWGMLRPRFTEYAVPTQLLQRLYEVVGRYDTIPDEV